MLAAGLIYFWGDGDRSLLGATHPTPVNFEPTLDQSSEQQRYSREASQRPSKPPVHVAGYEPERFLGEGAYGEVWVASDRNTGRRVAIKFYTHRGGVDWSLLSREVEKLSFLFSDRYAVQLFEVGWDSDPPYYVMEYLENGSLADRIAAGPLPMDEAVAVFRDVAQGLSHAHGKGVLHCDLKPANVLLDQDHRPRLADFGQSRLSHEQTPALGTLFYMAPEQANLKAVPDARWDVYALGALLYCMLTGQPPYRAEGVAQRIAEAGSLDAQLAAYARWIRESPRPSAHRRMPGVDRELAEIVDRCLHPQPSHRFPNVQAVLDALRDRETRRARRPLLVLGAVGPALLLAVMAILAWKMYDEAIRTSDAALAARALDTNAFAARLFAAQVATDIEIRWQTLEFEASAAEFVAAVEAAAGKDIRAPERERVQKLLNGMFHRHSDLRATSWFITDARGRQLAREPYDAQTVGNDYSYRDYFHGQGTDFEPSASALIEAPNDGPQPIRAPHRSIVYVSQSTKKRMLAFSVPVLGSPPAEGQERPVIGVLAMTAEVGNFTDQPPGEDQIAFLVDLRPDWEGHAGSILEHEYLGRLADQGVRDLPKRYLDAALVRSLVQASQLRDRPLTEAALSGEARGWRTLPDFAEPFRDQEPRYAGRWLVAFEPVRIDSRPVALQDVGWVVGVEERYEAVAAPVQQLGRSLIGWGLIGLTVVLTVITALWGFVLAILTANSRSRWTHWVRRRMGLPTPTYSGSLSGSGRGGSSRSGASGSGSLGSGLGGSGLSGSGPAAASAAASGSAAAAGHLADDTTPIQPPSGSPPKP